MPLSGPREARPGIAGEGSSGNRQPCCHCSCQHGCDKFSDTLEHNRPRSIQDLHDQENLVAQLKHDLSSGMQALESKNQIFFESIMMELKRMEQQNHSLMVQLAEIKGMLPNEAPRPTPYQNNNARYCLKFLNKPNESCFTTHNVKADDKESFLKIALCDRNNGQKILSDDYASLMFKIVVLPGDFNPSKLGVWTMEEFSSKILPGREKYPLLLSGHRDLRLENGEATLHKLTFGDNSSFTATKTFRLGVMVDDTNIKERILEGITEPFRVKDRRGAGTGCEREGPVGLGDPISKMPGIAEKRCNVLKKIEVHTMQDFLQALNNNPDKLQKALGKIPNGQWDAMVECAMKCDPGDGIYYYTDINGDGRTRIFFNFVHRVVGAIFDGTFFSHTQFNDHQKATVKRSRKEHTDYIKCIPGGDSPLLGSNSNHLHVNSAQPNNTELSCRNQEFPAVQNNDPLADQRTQLQFYHMPNQQSFSNLGELDNYLAQDEDASTLSYDTAPLCVDDYVISPDPVICVAPTTTGHARKIWPVLKYVFTLSNIGYSLSKKRKRAQ